MIKNIWTASRLKAFQSCPMKEGLRYRRNLAPIQGRAALAFGTAIHKGLETRSVDEALAVLLTDYPHDQEEADAQDAASVAVRALLDGYFDLYPPFKIEKPELTFELPMITNKGKKSRTYRIAGKIDNLVQIDGRWWIVEYKTASRLEGSYFDRLYLDSQITMYCYAMQRMGYNIAGIIYRVIRKPQIKKRQNESFDGYLDRLACDIRTRPEFYYTEQKLYRSMDDLAAFEKMIYQTATLEAKLAKTDCLFQYSTACSVFGACPYLPLCTEEAGAECMYEIKEPNQELL